MYQIFALQFVTVAKLQVWSSSKVILWLGSPHREELRYRGAAAGRLRSTAPEPGSFHLAAPVRMQTVLGITEAVTPHVTGRTAVGLRSAL